MDSNRVFPVVGKVWNRLGDGIASAEMSNDCIYYKT